VKRSFRHLYCRRVVLLTLSTRWHQSASTVCLVKLRSFNESPGLDLCGSLLPKQNFLRVPPTSECAAARNRTFALGNLPFPITENISQPLLQMSIPLAPAASPGSTNPTRPPAYSASNLVQGTSSFGFHGVYPPPYQPIGHEMNPKRELDLKKRRVSESRRQRTPMSCDRCKVRKIKVRTTLHLGWERLLTVNSALILPLGLAIIVLE